MKEGWRRAQRRPTSCCQTLAGLRCASTPPYGPAVTVDHLEHRFGHFVAVDRVSFEVRRGEIFGFLGPNGAGKSTTIRMLCGILAPTGGRGTVAGFDIRTQPEQIKANIGYMSQKFSLYQDLTVEENIDFYSGIYRIPARRKGRAQGVGASRWRAWTSTATGPPAILSGGWKQRLALGCAILHEPPILFLDEPTSGVDPISRRQFWDLIYELSGEGVTVFVTTHYMDEAEYCDRLGLIYRGELIALGHAGTTQARSDAGGRAGSDLRPAGSGHGGAGRPRCGEGGGAVRQRPAPGGRRRPARGRGNQTAAR